MGVRGMGPKKTQALLSTYDSLVKFIETGNSHSIIDITSSERKDNLLEIIERNRLLIDLRYYYNLYKDEFKISWFLNKQNPIIDRQNFHLIAKEYNMKSMLGKQFIQPFKILRHGIN